LHGKAFPPRSLNFGRCRVDRARQLGVWGHGFGSYHLTAAVVFAVVAASAAAHGV